MGKKHKHPEHENLERWLVSYADFITLLFATFVVLYALSQADLAKFKEVSKAIRDAFNPAKSIMQNPGGIIQGSPKAQFMPSSGNSVLDKVMPKFPENAQREGQTTPTPAEPAPPPVQQTVKEVNKQIENMDKATPKGEEKPDKKAELKLQDRGVVISLASNIFFEAGSSELKPSAYPLLDKLMPQLKRAMVQIEGHTDNQPISSETFPSNWELSSARASSVVRYLIAKHGMPPKHISAVGYAETRPIASNATLQGRKKNRRVDIVLLSPVAAIQSDAGLAHIGETNINVEPAKAKPVVEVHVQKSMSEPAKPDIKFVSPPPNPNDPRPPGAKTNTVFVESKPSARLPFKPINIRPDKPSIFDDPADGEKSKKSADKKPPEKKKPYPYNL